MPNVNFRGSAGYLSDRISVDNEVKQDLDPPRIQKNGSGSNIKLNYLK